MTDRAPATEHCQATRDHIFAYLVDQLPADARARYADHASACADCRDYVAFMDHAIHLECRALVELVTDYLEGALAPAERARFEAHLQLCDACATYLAQMRETIHLTGRLTEESIAPAAKHDLLAVFRQWKQGQSPST